MLLSDSDSDFDVPVETVRELLPESRSVFAKLFELEFGLNILWTDDAANSAGKLSKALEPRILKAALS